MADQDSWTGNQCSGRGCALAFECQMNSLFRFGELRISSDGHGTDDGAFFLADGGAAVRVCHSVDEGNNHGAGNSHDGHTGSRID